MSVLLPLAILLPATAMLLAFAIGGRWAGRLALGALGTGAALALLVDAAGLRAGAPLE